MGNDKTFLRRAVEIAKNGIKNGGGPFGAVLTKNGTMISEAFNRVALSNDPTAHAEILVIREAASILKTFDLSDCTLYASCEPCPMCLAAIYWAGIKHVVYVCDREDAEDAGFNDNFIYEEMKLKPSDRKILLSQQIIPEGKEVFRMWGKLENKIPY